MSYQKRLSTEEYAEEYRRIQDVKKKRKDLVNHPDHYTSHPSGIECIQITEHMGFCLGSAFKYIWRADLKDDAIQDLKKAKWFIDREIERRTNGTNKTNR